MYSKGETFIIYLGGLLMGNRALIKAVGQSHGVYLHWNGGRDSVEAFLKYCELRRFRGFEDDYGKARFVQVVANFFGGGLSIGITTDDCGSTCDNGTYYVKGWTIVRREHHNLPEQDFFPLQDMLLAIDRAQPRTQQLGQGFLTAPEVKTTSLRMGDRVYLRKAGDEIKVVTVVAIDDGKPVTDLYENRANPNNIIRDVRVRLAT